jgi:cytochrome oxidase Cu insertion factor (SCO1/SenC/PrrC family)
MRGFTLFFVVLAVFGCGRNAQPEIDYGTVPDFSLTDQNGKIFTRADLNGKVWIADFIFTNCAGTCPMITSTMRRLQDALPSEINLVSFSVDPERDTPEVLAEYAMQAHADGTRWHFLTGDKDKLYDLSIKGFKLALEDTGGTAAEPITHSTRLVLIDKNGRIRGYYGGTEDAEMKKLFTDATALL